MPKSTVKKKSLFGVHPGVVMMQKWVAELKEKTGRSLDEWLKFIKKEGPKDEKAARDWLKKDHDLGTNSAWWLAERALSKDPNVADDDPDVYLAAAEVYVRDQYDGSKEGLRPIFDALLELGLSLGDDVKACPCKTMVPFYRNHVFAEMKPTTRTRIDLGLALKDTPVAGRLIDTGGLAKKDRITRRIPLSSPSEIDAEVKRWLKKAYEMDAK